MNWQGPDLIIAAVIFYAGIRRFRSDLTGVRKVVDLNYKLQRKRVNNVLRVLRVALPEEHREKIIEMLPDDEE
jgi:hypothetical protein